MIQAENLYFSYPKTKEPTLKNIQLSIAKGEIFGVLGPSGAGKSTLQKILIGVLKGYEGRVQVLNQYVNKTDGQFYQKLGVAFETPNFYQKFTALENLAFFGSFYEKPTLPPEKLLAAVGLEEAKHMRVSEFSKGMKMRLNICRAFLHDPELVFLDEPTSGLDPLNVKKVMELIEEKKCEGKTIIINTHNMHVAEQHCDRVAFIVDGEIKLIDSPKELMLKHSEKAVAVTFYEDGEKKQDSFPLKQLNGNQRFRRVLELDQIVQMHTVEKSLEDLFIEVTGRTLQ
nr:ABC transporter ATP-binding protein [Evansella caseinilytica]